MLRMVLRVPSVIVSLALSHNGSQLEMRSKYAKDVTNTMSQTPENDSQTDTSSVKDVMYLPQWVVQFDASLEVKAKCGNCKTITIQFDADLPVVQAHPVDGLTAKEFAELGKLQKRVIFCTGCGGYRVTS